MATLSQGQIAMIARAAGLPGDPNVWAAVAMAESSGRTDVVNSIGCVGLWQINQRAHVKAHPTWTVAWLKNPLNNAKAAKVIYADQGWGAWEAYTGPDGRGSDGPWKDYQGKGGAVPAGWWDDFKDGFGDGFDLGPGPEDLFDGGTGNDGIDSLGALGDVATGVGTIAEAVQKAAVWMGEAKNWVRIGYVVGGGLLVAMGLAIVAKPILAGTPMARAATKAKAAVKSSSAKKSASKAGPKKGNGSE